MFADSEISPVLAIIIRSLLGDPPKPLPLPSKVVSRHFMFEGPAADKQQ
ncbi:hypothetical protein [Variovorax ginsengisoli]|uniref:Uncharacterized protein n=1 Tax=Variovorax ginsengisoli TaxID=363844 RepID=A0ABT9S837_9BURK|nr:hypothetical protein [Variovorax ginsengisoli]MDP9900033.1 hypothetical protein [Variovorax ginsengisoli]